MVSLPAMQTNISLVTWTCVMCKYLFFGEELVSSGFMSSIASFVKNGGFRGKLDVCIAIVLIG
jgi:hypothetical protein